MNKLYAAGIAFLLSFTGCIETEDDSEVDHTPSLRESVDRLYDYWNSRPYVTDSEWYCGIMVEPDGKFLNNSAKEECINGWKEFYDSWYEYFDEGFEMKLIDSNYTEEEKMNYKGVVYEVTVDEKYCSRYNSTEPWDCNSDYENIFLWALVDEKWGLAFGLDEYLKETEEETQDYDMTVTEVVDGDTFYLGNGDKVRMLGINTPESGRPYSEEATEFLTNMILGKEVTLVNDSKNGDSDSYGRLLAHVYVDGTFINYEIIKAGFAFWYPYTSGTDFDSEYEEAQDYASNNMAGLWTESSYNLTIDYIEYDPEGDEAEGEYVVLTNHENYNVSMVGWFLQDEAAQTAYEFDFIITNNTSIRIYTGDGTDNATTLFWGWHQGIWNNSGDFAIIQDENGYMVDSYRYD